MSTDVPYEVGCLEEIAGVHFGGGPWLGLYMQQDTGASQDSFLEGSGSVTIPNLTIPMFSGGQASLGGPSVKVLSSADIAKPYPYGIQDPNLFTLSVPGFTDQFGGKHVEQLVVVNLSKFTKPFTQTFNIILPALPPGFGLLSTSFSNFIWSNKQWKKGAVVNISFSSSFSLPPSDDDNGSALNANSPNPAVNFRSTWTIDPKKRTIKFVSDTR